jgi:excisionase family DNA binding protein
MTATATGVAYGGDGLHLPRRLTNSDRKESSRATTCHNKSATGVREGGFGSACVGGGKKSHPGCRVLPHRDHLYLAEAGNRPPQPKGITVHDHDDDEDDEFEFLDINEAAGVLRIPPATLRWWRSQGKGPRAVKFGRHVRIDKRDLRRWIAEQGNRAD